MLMNSNEYLNIVESIKQEIRTAQYRATVSVNRELLVLYHSIGEVINEHKTWGNRFVENLAADIKISFPDATGYSVRNRNRQISRRIKKHLWLSNRSWARDVHSFGILHSWGALAGKSCSAQASSIWLIAGAFRRTQSK